MTNQTLLAPDILISGAGIAGLWLFNHLKSAGYDVLLLERDSVGCGQTVASQSRVGDQPQKSTIALTYCSG